MALQEEFDSSESVGYSIEEKIMLVVLSVVALYAFWAMLTQYNSGPYYLGCADRHGSELVLQTEKRPRVEGSLVYIGDDVFVVPEPGMTCRIVTVQKLNEEKASKKVDNPI